MGSNYLPFEHNRVLYPGDDKITEFLRLPVEGADMPSQPVVDQREGDDLSFGSPTGDRVVLDV